MTGRARAWLSFWIVACSLVLAGTTAPEPGASAEQAPGGKSQSQLSKPLADLAAFSLDTRTAGVGLPKPLRDLASAGLMRLDAEGRVQVYVHASASPQAVRPSLEAAGAEVERVSEQGDILQTLVPPEQLPSVAGLPGVERVRLPDYARRRVGSVTTEGDSIHSAATTRLLHGIDGSGVRVGVISDGVQGIGLSQASGDLPTVDTTTCNVVPESPTAPGAGAEGTALLEIVHDLAPGAELWFGHFGLGFGGTSMEFMAAVDCLAQHTDVVVDDIGFYNNGLYDGTSDISQNASDELNDPGNPIRGYYTAAGNDAEMHYQDGYVDSGETLDIDEDTWNLQEFSASSETTEASLTHPCSCYDTIMLQPGGIVVVPLQWNDPWGMSSNDYDLFLLDGPTVVAVGGEFQDGLGFPAETVAYVNETGFTQRIDIAIGNFNGTAAPREFDMFVLCAGCLMLSNAAFHNFNTRCNSISNNSDADGGVIALGAIFAGDAGNDEIEPFSSCGPTNDGRTKPDASAVDGVSVTGNGGFPSIFFGTSAAAPHAAGIAALVLDCNATLSRAQLHDALLTGAVDLGDPGTDNIFGAGRLNTLATVDDVGCIEVTPTPTDTPTTVAPSPTATRTSTPDDTVFGDANCDGEVDAIDAALILQYLAGLIDGLPCTTNADANDDGTTNAVDAALVLQYVAGLIDSLPP
jgi:hypothetical protein